MITEATTSSKLYTAIEYVSNLVTIAVISITNRVDSTKSCPIIGKYNFIISFISFSFIINLKLTVLCLLKKKINISTFKASPTTVPIAAPFAPNLGIPNLPNTSV